MRQSCLRAREKKRDKNANEFVFMPKQACVLCCVVSLKLIFKCERDVMCGKRERSEKVSDVVDKEGSVSALSKLLLLLLCESQTSSERRLLNTAITALIVIVAFLPLSRTYRVQHNSHFLGQ
jgi:hypothetical protein